MAIIVISNIIIVVSLPFAVVAAAIPAVVAVTNALSFLLKIILSPAIFDLLSSVVTHRVLNGAVKVLFIYM
jgi:hypothetical protein